jgi:FAD/FMN-containing dehydrogenase
MQKFDSAVDDFRSRFKGTVLREADAGYAARPIWNAMWDHCRPALIARCVGAADVRAAVLFAREHDLPTAVRGGGHSASGKGTCDGGLVIDLSTLKGVHVNPRNRTAVAGGGCLWDDYDRETQAFGLATPGGVVSHTGVGGFALGGGIGWLSRRFGLTCDNVVAADLVTADGQFVRASETENPELFWGLRGGGGNFGVVTHFTLKVHEVGPEVTCGILMWPIERAAEAWGAYAELADSAPDELGCTLGVMRAPAAPFVDESLHDKWVAGFFFCWSGPPEKAEAAVAPFLARRPAVRSIGRMPYTTMQKMVDFMSPHGRRSYWKSGYAKGLEDPLASVVVEHMGQSVSPRSQAEFVLFGGAVARVPELATAFGDRTGKVVYNVVVNWTDAARDDANKAWANSFFRALQPFSTDAVYVNFLGDEGIDRIRAAYGDKYDRLARLKRAYDPTNFFRLNQNIIPAEGPAGS